MLVLWPSTWGMITAVSRDFRVATYSVVSFTATRRAISTFTGIPAGPWGCAPRAEPPLQAMSSAASAKVAASAACNRRADGRFPASASKSIFLLLPTKNEPAARLVVRQAQGLTELDDTSQWSSDAEIVRQTVE